MFLGHFLLHLPTPMSLRDFYSPNCLRCYIICHHWTCRSLEHLLNRYMLKRLRCNTIGGSTRYPWDGENLGVACQAHAPTSSRCNILICRWRCLWPLHLHLLLSLDSNFGNLVLRWAGVLL